MNETIEFGSILRSSFQQILSEKYYDSKIVIIVDENTHDNCLEFLLTSFDMLKDAEVMLLPPGEENKVMEVCFQVWQALTDYRVGRKDLIINLGGGVITDMGGFIASIFKRGIDFMHIPTSLLAMVDASIGGKNGIDMGPYKNQLGVFRVPTKIYIDPAFLSTLPEDELWNGFAEMIKHALIADKDLYNGLCLISNSEDLKSSDLIKRSVFIKQKIVDQDPLDVAERMSLNFGHTVGHGIEGYLLDKEPISHGHAVALGIIVESFISYKKGLLTKVELDDISNIIQTHFDIIELKGKDVEEIYSLMLQDKKNDNTGIQCVLLNGIGSYLINQVIDDKDVKEAFTYLKELAVKDWN